MADMIFELSTPLPLLSNRGSFYLVRILLLYVSVLRRVVPERRSVFVLPLT